jgi:hypothetical protein
MTDHIPRGTLCDCGTLAIEHRPKHTPRAWPICDCGAEACRHRVKHIPKGDPCTVCGLAKANHLTRSPREIASRKSEYCYSYVGIDGEGIGRGPHRYVLLAAATENGRTWYTEASSGLSTKQCLDFILQLPNCRLFAFSFGYDLTKILQDVDNETLYRLIRPSLRYRSGAARARGPKPVRWREYTLNYLNGKFLVKRDSTRRVIWDIYKFYQSSFVTALERWAVGETEFIAAMKKRRGQFKLEELDSIRRYCFTECTYLAQLAKKLIETHSKVGLKLTSYYGPGSTASIAMRKMGIRELRGKQPQAMQEPIACAFFGGRFEHSVMGPINSKVYSYDISSAYPYHLYGLPCLVCGRWVFTTSVSNLKKARTALIHYSFEASKSLSWAPFPLRDMHGDIHYPYRSEGWVWYSEYLAATRHFKGVKFIAAWVYYTDCDCRPFADVARYYRDRISVGKDAAGIVIKLAINSIYGKLAQSTGLAPPYQSWLWAGMVTAGTRAQILDLMHSRNRSDVLAIATDGIYAKRKLRPDRPIDTGTFDLSKPLGGWEEKEYPDGMFFVKPGIYFPLKTDLEPEHLRARGIGRKTLLDNRQRIIEAYERGDKIIKLPNVDRFHGLKTCISRTRKRSPRFGEWQANPIKLSFDCPNRNPDMSLRAATHASYPYSKSMLSRDKLQALISEAAEFEQPK